MTNDSSKLAMYALMLLLLVGCSGAKVTTKESSLLHKYHIQRIALLPFETLNTPQVVNPAGLNFAVPEGVKGSNIAVAIAPSPSRELSARSTATVPSFAGEKVTELFWNRLRAKEGLVVLSAGESGRVTQEVKRNGDELTPEAVASRVASKLSVDAAVLGRVLVYQEREGSRLGASPPATVGFEMKVVAADGQLLWEGNYYEKQRPVTEDLMGFFAHGFGFTTADALAIYGADQLAKEFPFGRMVEKQ